MDNRLFDFSSFGLFQQVKYHARSKTRTVNNVLFEKKQGKIDGGGTDVWRDEKMFIPPVPPSYLLGCKIIDIRYLIMVSQLIATVLGRLHFIGLVLTVGHLQI